MIAEVIINRTAKKLNRTIVSSNSWKYTKPLRKFVNYLRK